MRGAAQEANIGTGTEDLVVGTCEHHAANLGVLKAQAVDRIVQLDVDREIVGVQLEVVHPLPHWVVFLDVHRQRCNSAFGLEIPVDVPVGVGLKADGRVFKIAHAYLWCCWHYSAYETAWQGGHYAL